MASISIRNISQTERDGLVALKRIQLEIADREFVVLAGPVGAGKSSLLRLISGLENPAEGEIFIGDKPMNDLLPKDRDVGMVFPEDALYPRMSVFDNLAFGLKLRKYSAVEIKKRVADTAAVLRLEEFLARKPDALSASQRQRVAVGRAIVRQPKVVLFDEPLGALKGPLRTELRMEISKLHQRLQTTSLYATRHAGEALQMADRLVVLNEGAVQQADVPQKVYEQPANLFVAGFFGSLPMNFVHGSLKADGEKIRFRERDGGTIEVTFAAEEQPAAAPDYIGKDVIFGIRPEDLEATAFSRRQSGRATAFPAIADVVEPAGNGTNLYLETGAHTLLCVSREKFERQEAGHRFQFEINLKAAHLFDPVSTRRII